MRCFDTQQFCMWWRKIGRPGSSTPDPVCSMCPTLIWSTILTPAAGIDPRDLTWMIRQWEYRKCQNTRSSLRQQHRRHQLVPPRPGPPQCFPFTTVLPLRTRRTPHTILVPASPPCSHDRGSSATDAVTMPPLAPARDETTTAWDR